MEEPREESRSNRWLLVALLILLLLLLLWILAALQLEPAAAGSRIDISLRSRLAADYSPGEAAPMGSLQLSIVGEIFEDLGLAPSEASAASDTVKIGLLAPVPTATARNYQGEPPATATIAPTKEPTEAPTEEPSSTASPQLFNTATDEPTEEPEKEAKTKPTDTPTTSKPHAGDAERHARADDTDGDPDPADCDPGDTHRHADADHANRHGDTNRYSGAQRGYASTQHHWLLGQHCQRCRRMRSSREHFQHARH